MFKSEKLHNLSIVGIKTQFSLKFKVIRLNNDTKFENPRLKVRKLQKLGFLGSKTYFSFIGNLVDHRPIEVHFDRKYENPC